ncbi:MAG: hypothetical protein M1819_006646 [Sarea resinae]|nr:MAG: hypothetical protein M1819_006646 [Sarea resinae]
MLQPSASSLSSTDKADDDTKSLRRLPDPSNEHESRADGHTVPIPGPNLSSTNDSSSGPRLTENAPFERGQTLNDQVHGAPSKQYGSIPSIDTSNGLQPHGFINTHPSYSPLSAGLRLQTDLAEQAAKPSAPGRHHMGSDLDSYTASDLTPTLSTLPARTPSVKGTLSATTTTADSLSPASAFSSPALGPMADLTPLPSPIVSGDSPGPWKWLSTRRGSKDSPVLAPADSGNRPSSNGSISSSGSQRKRRNYYNLMPAATEAHSANIQAEQGVSAHSRNRSLSDFVPDSIQLPRHRQVTMAGTGSIISPSGKTTPPEPQMHREEYLAAQRGLTVARPPTPPASSRSGAESSDNESPVSTGVRHDEVKSLSQKLPYECFEARTVSVNRRRKWRAIRLLGQGTFSKVHLATSEGLGEDDDRSLALEESQLNPRKLVAVKVIEHGPAGGADETRVESSLKRELDILKSINHPSVVHLKAYSVETSRALLVLGYCPGGDLFDVASAHLELLVPELVRRIFAELVAAVQYLHQKRIVHRDIKLENVLLNLRPDSILSVDDWQTFPSPVVTLTDLGLSRYVPKEPESPLLHTRCGSEDYAAPELLMGQPYDGRATDAWALGVLLYAIMEGRLPFDPLPGQPAGRSRTAHRVARVEWSWYRFADEDGEWDEIKGQELSGARPVVEGLLKRARTRLSIDAVAKMPWVKDGVQVEGGLKIHSEEEEEA